MNENNLGEQPLGGIMAEYSLKPHDLVAVSNEQITHKMVQRAIKGRRLTPNIQAKIMRALNKATNAQYTCGNLFTY